jgi:hypothetical protein
LAEIRKVISRFPHGYKFNDTPGMQGRKILVSWKAPEPLEWLIYEGVKPPGEITATKNYPGVIAKFDSGSKLYLGAQKPYFHETFIEDGSRLSGRWMWRALVSEELSETAPTEAETFTWLLWKPDDQTPYVLGDGARSKGWVPPKGVSCLPPRIRDKIPKEFQYWNETEPIKRKLIRDQLVKADE